MDYYDNLYKRTSNPRPPIPTLNHFNQPYEGSKLNRRDFQNMPHDENLEHHGEPSRLPCNNDDYEDLDRQHRTTSIHRNMNGRQDVPPRNMSQNLERRRNWLRSTGDTLGRTPLEKHATRIANHMEQDAALMEDSPESEQLRKEALRDMPQCLTIKRHIKRKLSKSVSQKSKHKPLGYFKRTKYRYSIALSKFRAQLKNLVYTFELWYSSLKTIEGQFGSGVATYFKFLRWLFLMDIFVTVPIFCLITVPNLLYTFLGPNSTNGTDTAAFHAKDVFTGGGYFTNTSLFYGYYTNEPITLLTNLTYNMPQAYFFTNVCMIVVSFIILSVSMARSYRRNFIETEGGLKNVFAHKIFCGWDYGIATKEAAELKSSAIYFELKELLSDLDTFSLKRTWLQVCWTRSTQVVANVLWMACLAGVGYVMWLLLEQHKSKLLTTNDNSTTVSLLTAVFINAIMFVFPWLLSFFVKYEYKSPRVRLNVTLLRTFLLEIIVVGVLIGFWLTHSTPEDGQICWETSLGQEIYRIILFDFMFSVVLTTLVELGRFIIYKISPKIGPPEFNIATHTFNVVYNQTLFWMGLFFAPLLSVMIVLKLFLTWYVRSYSVIFLCKPSSKSWRSAQMQTWFLIMDFLSLLMVIAVYGFIMIEVPTSDCGPFRNYTFIYEMVLQGVLNLEKNNSFWVVLMYLLRPGVIALILIAMCMCVYYLRARAYAQRGMVKILREMLVWEAKDKEFLLAQISKVTKGQWQYNLQESRADVLDPFNTAPDVANSVWDRIHDDSVGDMLDESDSFMKLNAYNYNDSNPDVGDHASRYKKHY